MGIAICAVAAPFFCTGHLLVLVYVVLAVAAGCNWTFGRRVAAGRAEWLRKAYTYGSLDIAMGTAIIALTGGGDSPFVLGYFPVVAHAAVRFGRRVALLSSGVTAIGYLAATAIGDGEGTTSLARSLLTVGFIALTAVFAGLLSDRAHGAELALARQLDRERGLNVATPPLSETLEWTTVVRQVAEQGRILASAQVAVVQLQPGASYPEDSEGSSVAERITDALPGGAYLAKTMLQGDRLSNLPVPEEGGSPTFHNLGPGRDGLPQTSLLRAPLLGRGRWIGDLLLLRATPHAPFEQGDVGIVHAFAGQAALALENARLFESAREQATTDPITGLPNHRALKERLDEELARAGRRGRPLCVLMLDIDHFKVFNDSFGHAAGDLALRELAAAMRRSLRRGDFGARYAGEEFVVILPEADAQTGAELAERLRVAIAGLIPDTEGHGLPGPLTVSVGVASYPEHGDDRDAVLRAADHAMYLAKHIGRNQVCVAGELGTVRGLEALVSQLVNHLTLPSSRLGPHLVLDVEHRFRRLASLQQQAVPDASNPTPEWVDAHPHTIQAVTALAAAIDAKDPYTEGHSRSVAALGTLVAGEAGLPPAGVEAVRIGGLLHDIGKIAIPEEVLNKPSALDETEWALVRAHPDAGVRILSPIAALAGILPIVRHHHERWDGLGYPLGLRGETIPLGARIVSICDAYDTMVSDRPYRRGLGHEEALRRLSAGAGTQFDPALIYAFTALPPGACGAATA